MEEDYQDTIVLNKDEAKALEAKVAEAQAKAQEEAEAEAETEVKEETATEAEAEEKEDSIPDDIEYTLLVHEFPDLTVVLPKPEPAAAVLERAVEPGDKEGSPEETETENGDTDTESGEAETEGLKEGEEETSEEEKSGTGYGLPEGHEEIGELNERIAARRRYNERKKRRFRARFYIITTILIFGVFFGLLSLSSIFTVDSIEVRGNKHYTAEEIINMGHAVPGRNLFYGLNKKETEEYLEQNPYIKSAKVSRKLPSTMVIKVTERKEKLAFRYDDDFLIMDDEGILLKKTITEPKITMVKGMIVSKIKLGETVGTEDQKLFSNTLKLIRAMNAADMYFVSVDMSTYDTDFQVRAYIYDNLVVRGEYQSVISFLENGRLHKIVEKLFEDDVKRGTIILGNDGTASFEPGI